MALFFHVPRSSVRDRPRSQWLQTARNPRPPRNGFVFSRPRLAEVQDGAPIFPTRKQDAVHKWVRFFETSITCTSGQHPRTASRDLFKWVCFFRTRHDPANGQTDGNREPARNGFVFSSPCLAEVQDGAHVFPTTPSTNGFVFSKLRLPNLRTAPANGRSRHPQMGLFFRTRHDPANGQPALNPRPARNGFVFSRPCLAEAQDGALVPPTGPSTMGSFLSKLRLPCLRTAPATQQSEAISNGFVFSHRQSAQVHAPQTGAA